MYKCSECSAIFETPDSLDEEGIKQYIETCGMVDDEDVPFLEICPMCSCVDIEEF